MRASAWFVPLLVPGCLMPDLSDTLDPGPPVEDGIIITDNGAEFVIDATDREVFVAFDIDTLETIDVEDPSWDLAFRRFEIDLQEGLEAAVVDGVTFEDLVEVPPDDAWSTDEPDADEDGLPEYVFAEWYDYDYQTHTLSPANRVYAVRTTEDAVYKVGFDGYYDDVGTPARISVRVALLEEAP